MTIQKRETLETKAVINTEMELLVDLDAKAEFVAFYIPETPQTFNLCHHLAEQYKAAFTLKDKVAVEGGITGERPTNIKELQFTKRIYIYHESHLLIDETDKLHSLYKRKKLSLVLRGPQYAFNRNNPIPMPPRIPEEPSSYS